MSEQQARRIREQIDRAIPTSQYYELLDVINNIRAILDERPTTDEEELFGVEWMESVGALETSQSRAMSERYCSECEVTYRSEACPTCGWSEPPHTLADCREAMENHVGQRVQVTLNVDRLREVMGYMDSPEGIAAEYARLSRTGERDGSTT